MSWYTPAPKTQNYPIMRCFCGRAFQIENDKETCCSTKCAREDSLRALEQGDSMYRQKARWENFSPRLPGRRPLPQIQPPPSPPAPAKSRFELAPEMLKHVPSKSKVKEVSVPVPIIPIQRKQVTDIAFDIRIAQQKSEPCQNNLRPVVLPTQLASGGQRSLNNTITINKSKVPFTLGPVPIAAHTAAHSKPSASSHREPASSSRTLRRNNAKVDIQPPTWATSMRPQLSQARTPSGRSNETRRGQNQIGVTEERNIRKSISMSLLKQVPGDLGSERRQKISRNAPAVVLTNNYLSPHAPAVARDGASSRTVVKPIHAEQQSFTRVLSIRSPVPSVDRKLRHSRSFSPFPPDVPQDVEQEDTMVASGPAPRGDVWWAMMGLREVESEDYRLQFLNRKTQGY